MSARDIYHHHVKAALEKDGWTITHDPLRVERRKNQKLQIDLGAERLLGAEKEHGKSRSRSKASSAHRNSTTCITPWAGS